MNIAEKLERMNEDDAIELGDIARVGLKSEFGKLFIASVDQLKRAELQNSRARSESSDKVLGRLEGYETIVGNLEGFVTQADELRAPVQVEEEFEEHAVEQKEPLRGGTV